MCILRGAIGQAGDIGDVAVDLFGDTALFFSGACDLTGHVVDALYGQTDAFQCVVWLYYLLNASVSLVVANFHTLYGAFCGPLEVGNQPVNLLGGLGGSAGERAYFIGYYGKSAALLARAGGLDGCVQCEQIGLIRDALDHIHNGTDLACVTGQFIGYGGGGIDRARQRFDGFTCLGGNALAVHHQLAGFAGSISGVLHVT